jgi:hypothetical protein
MASRKANLYSRSQLPTIVQAGINQLDEDKHVLIARQALRVAYLRIYSSGAAL